MAKRRSEADRRARQSQRIGRALRLLCLIQDRHGRWDLPNLARELGCSTRTVQRDLLALEDAHIPFFYDKQDCCYRVRPGFHLSILNDQSKPESKQGAGDQSIEAKISHSSSKLAASSKDHAERILAETELLIDRLTQLCQALRQVDHRPETKGPEGE